jgi:hypothetical protein
MPEPSPSVQTIPLDGMTPSKIYRDQYGNVKIYFTDTNKPTKTGKPGPFRFHVSGDFFIAHNPTNVGTDNDDGKTVYTLDPTLAADIPLVVNEEEHAELWGPNGLQRITNHAAQLLPINELFTNGATKETVSLFMKPFFVPDKTTRGAPYRWYCKHDNGARTFKNQRTTLREAVKWNYVMNDDGTIKRHTSGRNKGKKIRAMPDWRYGNITQITEGSSFTEIEMDFVGVQYKSNQWKPLFRIIDTILDPDGISDENDTAAPFSMPGAGKPAMAPAAPAVPTITVNGTTTNDTTTNDTTTNDTTTNNTAGGGSVMTNDTATTTNTNAVVGGGFAASIPSSTGQSNYFDDATANDDEQTVKRPRLQRSSTITSDAHMVHVS